MKPLDPEITSLLKSVPAPINNTDLGAAIAPHLRALLIDRPSLLSEPRSRPYPAARSHDEVTGCGPFMASGLDTTATRS
jgi:hypothetical protein